MILIIPVAPNIETISISNYFWGYLVEIISESKIIPNDRCREFEVDNYSANNIFILEEEIAALAHYLRNLSFDEIKILIPHEQSDFYQKLSSEICSFVDFIEVSSGCDILK